jgi:hypothetical protein
MTSFPWVEFGRLLIYFILGLSLKDNGKKNYVAISLRSNAHISIIFIGLIEEKRSFPSTYNCLGL